MYVVEVVEEVFWMCDFGRDERSIGVDFCRYFLFILFFFGSVLCVLY